MLKQKYLLFFTCFSLLCIFSCKKDENKPLPGDDLPPKMVSKVNVKNIPGGAELTYSLPPGRATQYVEAQWKDARGKIQTAKASSYGNLLKLEGFADTLEHQIQLYSVNNMGRKSEPVSVTIKPLTPPLLKILRSIQVNEDFGGCYVAYTNSVGASVMIGVVTPDPIGEMNTAFDYYTSLKEGHFNVRGFSPEERKFGFYVRDQWGNYSDTIYSILTPRYEEFLDKSKFKLINLPGDLNGNYYSEGSMVFESRRGWDGDVNTWTSTWIDGSVVPNQSITIDLGVSVTLSRFKMWQRLDYPAATYGVGNLRRFEVWGRNDAPTGNGDWANWTQVLDCEVIKPSGLPDGQVSNDDMEAFLGGHEFSAAPTVPTVRYIRLKYTETWGGTPYCYFSEISLWGAIQ